ncbi:MAG: ammonium transporter [Brevinematales bacterium]|nr:ammonium transporter [Brevinematales bacterium]
MEKSMLDILWVNVSAILVFCMQLGFAFLEAGLTRSKNSINVALKNLCDFGISVIAYWAVGFGLMFGSSWYGFVGTNGFLFTMNHFWEMSFFFFQAVFCSTAVTIVSGAVAERVKFHVYLISTCFLSLFIYPVVGHWAWGGGLHGSLSGWLGKNGFVDFAGSTVVHSVGGWMALAYLLLIGPRKGIFHTKNHQFVASNIPLAIGGVFILWFGWFGFNGGSALLFGENVPKILVNTMLAACSGMIMGLLAESIGKNAYKVEGAMNGTLGGLVGITANCHAVNEYAALLIGGGAAILVVFLTKILIRLRIDDAVGAIPVHLGAGIWGTLAVALFGQPEMLGTGLSFFEQLRIQIFGILAIGAFTFFSSLSFLWVVNKVTRIRVSPEIEEMGLNWGEHGVKTESYDLLMTIKQQAISGDISSRVPVDPFTEYGIIGYYYNKALDEIEKHVVSKEDYLQIMDTISEGLCLIEKDLTISPSYSKHLETIFEETSLGGKNILDLFRPHLCPKNLEILSEYFSLYFDPHIEERNLQKVNPFERLEFVFDNLSSGTRKSKYLSGKLIRIKGKKNEGIEKLLLLVQDETTLVLTEKETEKNKEKSKREMELLYKIIHIDLGILEEFLHDTTMKMHTINHTMQELSHHHHLSQEKLLEFLDSTYRHLHSLKGNARLLELEDLATCFHTLESILQKIRHTPNVEGETFVEFLTQLSAAQDLLSQLQNLLEKLKAIPKKDKQHFFSHLEAFAHKIAKQEKKEIIFSVEGSEVLESLPFKKEIQDILIQLIKNAIVHGVEPPEDRKNKGKNPQGLVRVRLHRKPSSFECSVFDDGQGIHFDKIREKAVLLGFLSPHQEVSPKELVGYLFQKGFSTAERLSHEAGRGIGLDIVYDWIVQKRGKILVKTRPQEMCEFILHLPLS